ncbi:MAG: type II secretion system inner membrane protein GspF [Deltaproteobacteria bacterium]|nr:type II secretion system inner membrane protein GspF [Deltaproteobacteria bacterium]
MPVYAYKGLSTEGRAVAGVVDAESPRSARLKLRRTGVFPTDLAEDRTPAGRRRTSFAVGRAGERVPTQELAAVTRQLATLVGAGLPLVEALAALADQTEREHLRRAIVQIRERVTEGRALADALGEHPRLFSPLYVNMVRAGEASGALDVVLERLADYTENQARLLGKVRAALTYPAVMLVLGGAILFFLVSYVVPKVTRIFQETQQQLPRLTLLLIALSSFAARWWWLILLALGGAVLGGRAYAHSAAGRERVDRWVLQVPYVGRLVQKFALARFARTLSTLLASGIGLLPALDIVRNIVDNRVIAHAIENARDAIREGQSIAPPLRESGVFPPLVVHMVAVGERSGQLEEMLGKAADAYDNEVENAVGSLTTILEPLMIVFMGLVVLFIVLAILMPIFELNRVVR